MSKIFLPALTEMESQGGRHFGPISFQSYAHLHGLQKRNTAQHISIDCLSKLDGDLRKSGVMVFRLGTADGGRTTQFALARSVGWSDYFFLDEQIFLGCKPDIYIPTVSYAQLYAFTLLSIFTETSLVNLAIASGLMAHALHLDEGCNLSIPATGQTAFTFSFGPRSDMELLWIHNRGQIEIDAVFTGTRNGKECLFVVEAKAGDKLDSLAKHKLLYPILALKTKVPRYISIIPVYVRAVRRPEGMHFHIAECEYHGAFDEDVFLDRLGVKSASIYVLAGMGTS